MSDTDPVYDRFSPADFILQNQRRVMGDALSSLDDDPEKAARSIQLGKATGDSPSIIYPNLENYETQHKAALTSQLLSSSKYLRQFIDADPMHAKVSNDDYANLDAAGEKIAKVGEDSPFRKWLDSNSIQHAFMEGMGDESLGMRTLNRPENQDFVQSHPFLASVLSIPDMMVEAIGRPMAGVLNVIASETGSRDIPTMLEYLMMRGDIGTGKFDAGGAKFVNANLLKQTQDMLPIVANHLKAGEIPPRGIHPIIDRIHDEQAAADAKTLKEAEQAVEATATKGRSPDTIAQFSKIVGDRSISVTPDAVRKLYGEEAPHPDDGKLGMVPDLAAKLSVAEESGVDVRIPLSDWLAHVDPEVRDQLRDDIRFRTEGQTKNEAKEASEQKVETESSTPKEVIAEPVPTARAAAGLEPLFSNGDRKVTIKQRPHNPKIDKASSLYYAGKELTPDHFQMLNEKGEPIGFLDIIQLENGKKVFVSNTGAFEHKGYGPNSFGNALTRDLVRQIKTLYPDAEQIGGYRISGAREKAGKMGEMWIKFDDLNTPNGWSHAGELRDIFEQQTVSTGHSDLHYSPELTAVEAQADKLVRDTLSRVAPHAQVFTPTSISAKDKPNTSRQGFMWPQHEQNPWIVVSLDSARMWGEEGAQGIARHEAMHYLKRFGFFKDGEWDNLVRAARDNNWLKDFGINDRYPNLPMEGKFEEAIAEGYRAWADGLEVPKALHPVFERLKELFKQLKDGLKELLGREPTWEELFQKIESGEVAQREPTGHKQGAFLDTKFSDQPELPGATRMEDRAPFERGAITTKGRHDIYMRHIEQRHKEDMAASEKRIAEEQRKRQTKEWKDNRAALRKDIDTDVHDRPDVAADLFFGAKELYGEKVAKTKLDAAKLTDEQKAALPKDYYGKDGIDPDDAARLFGYDTGDRLVNRLGAYNEVKLQGNMSAKDFVNRIVDIETDRQMELKYGDLAKNILEDTKEQILSENQLNILHEETYRRAIEAKLEFTLTKEQMKASVKAKFLQLPVGEVSSKEFLRASGKFGQATEDALQLNDPISAFKAKQVQTYSNIYAAEALKVEKAQKQLDRTAKMFKKGLVPSVEAEYTNHIQDLLQQVGYKVNRTAENIAENIERNLSKNVVDFAAAKLKESHGYREIPVPDFLGDPKFNKQIADMTVDEFSQFKQTIDALVRNGRDEMKITKDGEAHDLAIVKGKMIEQIRDFPLRTYKATKGLITKATDWPRVFMAGTTIMETIFNRFDRDDPRGVFNQYINYPLAKSANYKSTLQREYAKPYGELGEIKEGNKLVSAPFPDPLSITPIQPDGVPWAGFTRKNVLAMLQNAGNKSNWRVLAKGYGTDPEALMGWLVKNTTKEDWQRAQKMGDTIFKSLISKADREYEILNGITVDKIPLEPIENEHGKFGGWYHPLIEDPIRKGKGKVRGGAYEDTDFGHASTANGYTKARTGAVYPLDLNFDMVPVRMNQMIHDIAFRRTVLDVQKIFKDPNFHNAITQHYGEHYADLLMPYLKGVAGAESIPSKAGSAAARVSEAFRQNVISTYIGFNPYTALKHGPTAMVMSGREVGPVNFANAVRSLYGQSPELGLSNSEFAMKWSEELQRRERHWQDTIAGQHNEIEGQTNLRGKIVEKGSWLVAKSDMLSAKPTWLAAYESAIKEGSSHGEAIDLGDRAVRRAHGSTAVTNQPALVRGGGPLHGWLTSVYGFFGTAMQRRIEIAHTMNDTYHLAREGELKEAAKNIPGLTADIFSYVIWPTMVEEWVTGLTTEDRRGLGTHIVSAAFMGLSSSVLYLRDIMHAFATGQDPGVGLISSPLHDAANLIRDLKHGKEAFSRQRAGKTVGDTLTVFGHGTGMTPKTLDNSIRFGIDLVNGQTRPKTFEDYRLGLTRGKIDKRIER